MPIETAPYVGTLNASNPAVGDAVAQGFNHLQLIKSALVATFPNLNGAVTAAAGDLNAAGVLGVGITATPASLNAASVLAAAITATPAALNAAALFAASTTATPAQVNMAASQFNSSGALVSTGGIFVGTTPVSFTGMVTLFSGPVTSIPTGWHLCDGTTGTPDLRGMFVVGAGGAYAVGASGGITTTTLTANQLPPHNHGVNDPGHNHGVADPGHNHGVYDPGHVHGMFSQGGPGGSNGYGALYVAQTISANTNGAVGTFSAATGVSIQGNSTGISLYGSATGVTTQWVGNGWGFENRPPFYAICYIMRVI